MQSKPNGAAATPDVDAPVRLRLNVYDALAQRRGATTVKAQALLHGIHRTTMFRLRSGQRSAGLALAMQIAADLGTTVEVLFERVSDG